MVQLRVANPVAESTVYNVKPADRPVDLNEKRIGLYWNIKAGGDLALDRTETLLQARYPDASFVRILGSVGSTVRHLTVADADQTAANCDVVVGTTGDCGGCTSWLAHDMKELESRGVATVALVADHFVEHHRRTAGTMGIAALPYAKMPYPFVNQTESLIHSMVEAGIDDVIRALTTAPESGQALSGLTLIGDPWLTFEADDPYAALDAMNRAMIDWQYSDGLPLVPATAERVDWLLGGTTRNREDVLGILEPGDGIATVEKVAINAAMAGCSPRHLPVVIAAVECLLDPRLGLRRKAVTTGPSAPMLVVNGPARLSAGLSVGPCMLGPGSPAHANVVIGRALRLCLQNVGHTYPGISEMDTIGSPNKFSFCIAENEEHSPWNPFHVDHGFDPGQSAVTLNYTYGLTDLQDFKSTAPEPAIKRFATGATYMGVNSTGHWLTGRRPNPRHGTEELEKHFILMAPEHTKIFDGAGWGKPEIARALHKEARLPFGFLATRLETSAIQSGHPELGWLWDSPDALVPVLENEDCYEVVVAGTHGSNRSSFVWGMGGPVTIPIRQADLEL